jgi:hypothetical protein
VTGLTGLALTVVFFAGAVVGWLANNATLSEGPWPPLERGGPE